MENIKLFLGLDFWLGDRVLHYRAEQGEGILSEEFHGRPGTVT